MVDAHKPRQNGSSTPNGMQSTSSIVETRFSFICEKGHTYEFGPRNMFNPKLKVTDKTLGKSMDIDDQGGD